MNTKRFLELDFELIDHSGVTVIHLTYIRGSEYCPECKSGIYSFQGSTFKHPYSTLWDTTRFWILFQDSVLTSQKTQSLSIRKISWL